ncbi:MAG: polymer-forming cytoskeletal protein, partial [Myxococcota bacterium]
MSDKTPSTKIPGPNGGGGSGPDRKANSTTTIGPTITIRGKLRSGEDLIVKGRIDAELTSSKAIFLENSGIVRANANVASAHISGILLGDVTANSKIELAKDGRMIGDMLAPRIVIQDGAAFRGKIDMPNFDTDEPPPRS